MGCSDRPAAPAGISILPSTGHSGKAFSQKAAQAGVATAAATTGRGSKFDREKSRQFGQTVLLWNPRVCGTWFDAFRPVAIVNLGASMVRKSGSFGRFPQIA
jgi:hypothetical protein